MFTQGFAIVISVLLALIWVSAAINMNGKHPQFFSFTIMITCVFMITTILEHLPT